MQEPDARSNQTHRPAGSQPGKAQPPAGRLPIPTTGQQPGADQQDERAGIQPERSTRVVNRVIERLNRL